MTQLVLQPDAAAGIDTYTDSTATNTSRGAQTSLTIISPAGIGRYPLIKFDLSTLPVGAIVTGATFSGTQLSGGASNIHIHLIAAANSSWNEGSTWNYRVPSTERWAGDAGADGGVDAGCSVSGTDYSATVMGEWTGNASNPSDISASLDLAQFALMWANNYGMEFVNQTGFAAYSIASSDHATAAFRPRLVIEYTLPAAGAVSISPAIGSLMPRGGVRITPVGR